MDIGQCAASSRRGDRSATRLLPMVTDLVISGGTVVTPSGTIALDVAVRDGRIERIGPGLARRRRRGHRRDRPARPARRRSTSTPTCACPTQAHPHRFRTDTAAAAARRHHDRADLQQPRHRHQRGRRAVAAARASTSSGAHDGGVGHRLRAVRGHQRSAGRPGWRAARAHRRRRADLQGVHGLRLPPARRRPARCHAHRRPARRHAPGPLRGAGDHRPARGRCAAARRDRVPLPRADPAGPRRGRRHPQGDRDGTARGGAALHRPPQLRRGARGGGRGQVRAASRSMRRPARTT